MNIEKLVAITYLSVIFYPFVSPVFYLIVRKLTIKDFHYPFLVTSVFLSILGYALAIAISYFLFYVESIGIVQQEFKGVLEEIVIKFFCSPLTITLYFITNGVIAVVAINALKPKLGEVGWLYEIKYILGTIGASGQWTGVYKYDVQGLLTEGVDARGVKTSFVYDGLNRVASVSYTGESGYATPNITYTYDEVHSDFYNKGRLTKVKTAANAAQGTPETIQNYDYDKIGQVVGRTH